MKIPTQMGGHSCNYRVVSQSEIGSNLPITMDLVCSHSLKALTQTLVY